METDDRNFGDLFYACCDEVGYISIIEALHRILILACDRIKRLNLSIVGYDDIFHIEGYLETAPLIIRIWPQLTLERLNENPSPRRYNA